MGDKGDTYKIISFFPLRFVLLRPLLAWASIIQAPLHLQ